MLPAGIVFAVIGSIVLGASLLLGPVGVAIVGVLASLIWSALSDAILDYIVPPTISSFQLYSRRIQYA